MTEVVLLKFNGIMTLILYNERCKHYDKLSNLHEPALSVATENT